jgi:putative endonuclease
VPWNFALNEATGVTRQAAEQRGRRAETIAAWWLRLHGWSILARRARVPGGEVDLVARRRHVLAFVEVKQRATADAAAWSLDQHRLRRVAVAAERLAVRYARPGDLVRIDALFIVPRHLPRHLPDVWNG